MQDQDAPPVEEGETGGGVGVVRAEQTQVAVADGQAAINSMAGFTRLQWTTAIALPWLGATTARGQDGNVPGSLQTIRRPIPTHYPCAKTRIPGFLASWTTSSSRPKFRKLPAN